MRRASAALALACAAGAALLAVPAAASPLSAAASSSATSSGSSSVAYVRAAHLSPDTPQVDVYLTSFRGTSTRLWLQGVGYGDVSPYRRLPAGEYALSMRPHGAPVSTAPALRWSVQLEPGRAYTAAAIGSHTDLHGIVIADTLAAPRAGTGYLRIVQAASHAGQVTVTAGRTTISRDTGYGSATAYVPVPAGRVTVTGRSLTRSGLRGSVAVTVASRSINSVVVLDAKGGGLVLRPLVDAAGAGTAPSGSIDAGGGGTAVPAPADTRTTELVGLLLMAGAGVFALRRLRTAG